MVLNEFVKVTRVMNAVAAGTTAQNSSVVDMTGWDGVKFILLIGTLSATQVTSLKAQQDVVVGFGGAADLAGTLTGPFADADGNKCLILDVYRPREPFVRCVVNRATANAVIDGVIAIQYGPTAQSSTPAHDSTTVKTSKSLVSPAEGTA